MNKRTHLALKTLPSAASLRYTGLVPRKELDEKLAMVAASAGPAPAKSVWSMAALVFGPWSISGAVARELSKFHLFLQHPFPLPPDTHYKNPQYLSINGSLLPNGTVLPPITTIPPAPDPPASDQDVEPDQMDFLAVIDHLPQHDYLKQVDVGNGIVTELYRQVTTRSLTSAGLTCVAC